MAVPITSSHQVQSGATLDAAAGGTIKANRLNLSVANTLTDLLAFSVRNSLHLRDDFVGGRMVNAASGQIGELGWSVQINGSGVLRGSFEGYGSMQGAVQPYTGATNGSWVNMHLWDDTQPANTRPLILSGVAWNAIFNMLCSGDLNPLKQCTFRIGFGDNTGGGTPTEGFYLEYVATTAVTTWSSVTAHSSTYTKTTLSTADGNQHTYEIRNDGANNITFYLDGSLLATHTANISTASIFPFLQVVNSEAGAKWISFDVFELLMAVAR